MIRRFPFHFTLLCLALILPVFSTTAADLQHHLSLLEPGGHLVPVRSTFPSPDDELHLTMSVWTPGSYLVREFSRHVQQFEARDGRGRKLDVSKVSKNRWRIDTGGSDTVTVTYLVYAREMTVRTSFFDDQLALLNLGTLLMVPHDRLGDAHRIELQLPADWQAHSALPRLDDAFIASDFDQLIDSPIVAGQSQLSEFSVRGTPHQLVHFGDSSRWDLSRAADDVATLVSRQLLFWGEFPYSEPYLFLNLITEAGGGLEHQRSTVMMAKRMTMQRREDYVKWLGLVSHEFFHVWNVKAMRPASLLDYDYQQENYTRNLWFAEGLTSYYGPVLLARAGLITPNEFFEQLAKKIRTLQLRPGRAITSVEQASFDAWIRHYRPDENSVNATVSYYNKGAVLGFLLDAEIRRRSQDSSSLDDLMRLAYSRYARQGLTAGAIRDLANELSGDDMTAWFDAHVEGTEELDYGPALDWFGLQLITEEEKKADELSRFADPPRASLGVKVEPDKGRLMVKEVWHGGSAHRAGLQAQDEILALDGIRVIESEWKDRFAQMRVDQTIEVLISRRGQIRTIDATLAQEPAAKWLIKDDGKAVEKYRSRLAEWLGAGWYPE